MEHPHEPIDVINSWQEWSRKHQIVAELDEPMATKDSRENLHDTSHAISEMPNWRSFFKDLIDDEIFEERPTRDEMISKATNYFADTIAEFLTELGGDTLYECFVAAAKQSFNYALKEYDINKDLMDRIEKKKR